MSSVSVYRAYDRDGTLLYVGRTNNLPARLRAHRREKPWWSVAARWTVENFDTIEEASLHETRAILTESPKHNVQHSGRKVVMSFRISADVRERLIEKAQREGLNPTEVIRDLAIQWAGEERPDRPS